ncbi:MAG: putative toxin-antitoxin system toxin component, PIN family [Muribaculaceae bacterium]|nr:putative toxin-antitoxin system toxin component, PIN family [Muribaculaceae bacterium]
MDRLVLDTNVLIQIMPSRSKYRRLWNEISNGKYELCLSTEILEEYEEILQAKTSVLFATAIIKLLINNASSVFVTPYYKFNLIQADPDDNKFVDCAVAGSAKYIVSDDRHFEILKSIDFPKVDVITLDEMMEELN